jgi:hypothetical protein
MATLLKHTLAACALVLAATSVCAAPASTETQPKAKATAKQKAKPKSKKAEAKPDAASAANKDAESEIADSVKTDYNCELGSKITIYTSEKDADHIALRWKNKLHRMDRVTTTTGAQRFEDTKFGLVWIGIPAKGILLDSKQGHQLANECKNAEQAKAAMAAPVEEKKG